MKVPRYDSQVRGLNVPNVAAPNIPIPSPSTAGDIQRYRDIQDLGATIGKIGGQVADRMQQRQEIEFKQQSADLRTDFSKKLDDKLMSTDVESVKDSAGNDVQRPVGVLNWKGNNASGAHSEFERYVDEIAPSYLNQVKNSKYKAELARDLYGISSQKGSTVLRHESNEWNIAKEDSFKGAIAQSIKDGDINSGDKASRDLASFQGINPDELIQKTRESIVRNSAVTRLQASPDASQSLAYLDEIDKNKIIDPEVSNTIRSEVKRFSKSLLAEKKLEEEATQNANFVKLVGGVLDGNIGIINSESIAEMSSNGDLPKGAGEALTKFLDISKLSPNEVNPLGLDESVVNHARAVLSVNNVKDLNEAIIDIMNDDKFTSEEGRNRAVVLLQVAKELGIQRNTDARKNANDSLGAVMSWYDKVGLPTSQGVLEFMKQIRNGVKPADAAQQTINQELIRQSAGKEKDQALVNTLFDVVDGRGHYSDLLPAFNAYFIKSGMTEPEAAQAANDLILNMDPAKATSEAEFLQNFAQALDKVAPGVRITADLPNRIQRKVEQKHIVDMIALDKSPAMDKFRAEHPYVYAVAVSVQDAGVAGAYFLDGLTANIPSYILTQYGYDIPAPVSGGGKALAGLGSVAGFVTGLPGKVGRAVANKVFGTKIVTKLIGKGLEAGGKAAAATKIGTNIAKTSLELGTMTATVTPHSGIADWRERGLQFIEGAETGAAFGALGVISSAKYPKITTAIRMGISSLWTGVPSMMAKQSIEEQVFQFGLGAYFGIHGIDFKEVKKFRSETVELAKEVKDPVGKEALRNTVVILDKMEEPVIVEKAKALKAEIPKQFVTGNEGALLDYLHLYMDPGVIARMTPSQRLQLGNMEWQQFRDMVDSGAFAPTAKPGEGAFPADPNAPGGQAATTFPADPNAKPTTTTGGSPVEVAPQTTTGGGVSRETPTAGAAATPEVPAAGKGKAPAAGGTGVPVEPSKVELDGNVPKGDKEHGLAKSTEARAIEAGLIKDLGELPRYQERPIIKEIAAKVQEFIAKDPERARRIALGHEKEPENGLRAQEIFSGLVTKAVKNDDVELIRELATSDTANDVATELGQRVKAYDRGPDETRSASTITKLLKERMKTAEKKIPGGDLKKATSKEVGEIKAEKKKSAPKLKDWTSFIDSLKC